MPDDFGRQHGGTAVENKSTYRRDIDRLLGRKGPPALELLYVHPGARVRFTQRLGLSSNPFGHTAISYTLDGKERLLNFVGRPGSDLVHVMAPEDYQLGTEVAGWGSGQGGMYKRQMEGVQIDKLDREALVRLDQYFGDLIARQGRGEVAFAFVPQINELAARMRGRTCEAGDCATWATRGLSAAGIISKSTMWPKNAAANLYQTQRAIDPDNVHMVSYRRVRHARTSRRAVDLAGFYGPKLWRSLRRFGDLARHAEVVVEVPEGTIRAVARPGPAR